MSTPEHDAVEAVLVNKCAHGNYPEKELPCEPYAAIAAYEQALEAQGKVIVNSEALKELLRLVHFELDWVNVSEWKSRLGLPTTKETE